MIACSEIGVERTRSSPKRGQAPGDPADAAHFRIGDILAQHHHGLVLRHRVGERAVDGFRDGDLRDLGFGHATAP
jgi:hypothetical protein